MAAVQLRVPAERRQLWQDAAARADLELQEWTSAALDLAAKAELGG